MNFEITAKFCSSKRGKMDFKMIYLTYLSEFTLMLFSLNEE